MDYVATALVSAFVGAALWHYREPIMKQLESWLLRRPK